MKNKMIYIITIFCSLLYIFVANKVILKGEKFFDEGETSRLILSEVKEIVATTKSEQGTINIEFTAELLKRRRKGKNCKGTANN